MDAKLKVVDGAKGAIIRLKLPTTIGRGSQSGLKVPSSQVSRSHCEIYEEDGLLAVHDLGSSNGTFINDEKITDPTFLYPGDLLRVGKVKLEAIYKADRSLVADDAAEEDADTGVTSSDAAAGVAATAAAAGAAAVGATAAGKKKAAAAEEPAAKKKVAEKSKPKQKPDSKPEPKLEPKSESKSESESKKEAAQPAATKEEVEGFDLDEALGIEPENESSDVEESPDLEVADPEPDPDPDPEPEPEPEKPAAKKPAAKKPAAKESAAVTDEDGSSSSVSAIVDYEENESGSFIAIDTVDGDATPPAEVSSFNIDVGEEDSPAAVSGFALDTGDDEPQSAVGSGIFKVGDEEDEGKSAVDGGDSALNDFFNNLE